jgi:hypothetical protein
MLVRPRKDAETAEDAIPVDPGATCAELAMRAISRKLVLSAAVATGAALLTLGPVPSMAGGVASVAHLQTDATAGGSPTVLAKDFKLGGGGGGGGIPPGPGEFKGGGGGGGGGGIPPGPGEFKGGGGGGKGGKGGKGGGHGWGPVVGGGIVLGLAHCAIQSERCEDTYGDHNDRYWRCMRRAGC